jgi:hypothetical protein
MTTIKKKISTYFYTEPLEEIDSFCKKANLSRASFLEIASKHYINSIENEHNLLSYAYNACTCENWTQNAVNTFLDDIWEVYAIDEEEILSEVLSEIGIEQKEFKTMIDTHGLEKICLILIKCMEKEVNSRPVKYFLK